jgi:protein quaking
MPHMNTTLESLTKCDPDFIMPSGFDENDKKTRDKCLYLKQLLADKRNIAQMPGVFLHMERLLDDEIVKVRSVLFQNNNRPLELPSPSGKTVTLSKKVFVPAKDYPDYNFVGRILGPRGLTAKQLEQETGCKIMVRGKGSMRDKKKEEQNRGRPNWEHLNEELHVLITVEDSENRAEIKLQRAIAEIEKLLIPAIEGEDDLKKKQLMELAIINGTYRDNSNGKQQNGISTRPLAIPANITLPPSINRFQLPTSLVPAAMAPSIMGANVLRAPNMVSQPGMAQMDQHLYYTPVPTQIEGATYPYTITSGLMNGMETYVSQNVSPHEGIVGSTGTSPGSSNSTNQRCPVF